MLLFRKPIRFISQLGHDSKSCSFLSWVCWVINASIRLFWSILLGPLHPGRGEISSTVFINYPRMFGTIEKQHVSRLPIFSISMFWEMPNISLWFSIHPCMNGLKTASLPMVIHWFLFMFWPDAGMPVSPQELWSIGGKNPSDLPLSLPAYM